MCWPLERQHERLGGDWGILLRLDWEPLQGAWVDHRSGQTRMPPQSDGTRRFLVWGILSHARKRRNEGVRVEGLIRCAGRTQERPFGAVTPLERRDED